MIHAGELFKTRDCQFWSCTQEADKGDLCAGHAFFVKRRVLIRVEDLKDEGRCTAFIKPRGVWEGQIRCSYPAKDGSEFCGRHDPANMGPKKVHAHIDRVTRVREAKASLLATGSCIVVMGRDLEAQSIIYAAAEQAGFKATTEKLGPGRIKGVLGPSGGTRDGSTGRVREAAA